MKIPKEYFLLQLTMLKRQITEFGISPLLALLITIPAFYGASTYLFLRSTHANYVYALIALSMVIQYTGINRNDFLKFTYPKKEYIKIRLLENLLTILPFAFFLAYKEEYYPLLAMTALATVAAFINTNKKISLTLPTPFYKKPFEFVAGFRKSIFGFVLAYFLTVMSITYQNFNLGAFSLVLVFLISLSFYLETENVFFVWSHNLKPKKFLGEKIATAFVFSTMLTLPVAVTLAIFFQANLLAIVGFQALGYCYLTTIILAKYANYPQNMNLPQGILVVLSLTMPPLILAIAPFFYIQSIKRLKEILG